MANAIETQNENIQNLLKLVQENPGLRIVPMVETECAADDSHSWWCASWGKAYVDELYTKNEAAYIRSMDEDTLIDEVLGNMDVGLSDEEAERLAEQKVRDYNWEKVILVDITPP